MAKLAPFCPERAARARRDWLDYVARTIPSWQIELWIATEKRCGENRYRGDYQQILDSRVTKG